MKRRALFVLGLLLAFSAIAVARPGGGESYSGGGGHGSGSGGGDGGGAIFELIYYAIRLCFVYPQIGVPILGFIVVAIVVSARKQHLNEDWDSGPPLPLQHTSELAELRAIDPEFSQVVFEDFAFRLFSTAHRARHSPQTLATVAPYVSPVAQAALAKREPAGVPVQQVVIGAMRTFRVDVPERETDAQGKPTRVRIGVEFEANVATADHTYYSVESWLFGREATRHSKPPGAARTFPCPNCGAPWQASATGTQQCASCGQIVDNGRFDWVVEQVSRVSVDERPPTLTTTVTERGTDLPTYQASDVDERWAELTASDPAVTEPALLARLAMIYGQLNTAWSNNALEPVRGLVSDGLYDYLQYWVDAYKRQGLRNQLVDMQITGTARAKIVHDRWYDTITIRIWGTGKDFVVRTATGDVVRGSKRFERAYSEYWTLIRSAQRKGPPKADATCGNCGAPLVITMSGACDHCGVHLTAGEFDWVLSKIEQDDSYRG
ncbi:MAG: putative rane protein [Myxococcales bacterium]|nr:putative rane protein [Myxococcales bacterium]